MVTVSFKSEPRFWEKEKSGVKPNTIRIYDEKDVRHVQLLERIAEQIELVNSQTGISFIRTITDVDLYKNILIISWRHEDTKVRVPIGAMV